MSGGFAYLSALRARALQAQSNPLGGNANTAAPVPQTVDGAPITQSDPFTAINATGGQVPVGSAAPSVSPGYATQVPPGSDPVDTLSVQLQQPAPPNPTGPGNSSPPGAAEDANRDVLGQDPVQRQTSLQELTRQASERESVEGLRRVRAGSKPGPVDNSFGAFNRITGPTPLPNGGVMGQPRVGNLPSTPRSEGMGVATAAPEATGTSIDRASEPITYAQVAATRRTAAAADARRAGVSSASAYDWVGLVAIAAIGFLVLKKAA